MCSNCAQHNRLDRSNRFAGHLREGSASSLQVEIPWYGDCGCVPFPPNRVYESCQRLQSLERESPGHRPEGGRGPRRPSGPKEKESNAVQALKTPGNDRAPYRAKSAAIKFSTFATYKLDADPLRKHRSGPLASDPSHR